MTLKSMPISYMKPLGKTCPLLSCYRVEFSPADSAGTWGSHGGYLSSSFSIRWPPAPLWQDGNFMCSPGLCRAMMSKSEAEEKAVEGQDLKVFLWLQCCPSSAVARVTWCPVSLHLVSWDWSSWGYGWCPPAYSVSTCLAIMYYMPGRAKGKTFTSSFTWKHL